MKNSDKTVKKIESIDKQGIEQKEIEKWDLKIEWDKIEEWEDFDLKWDFNCLVKWN